VQDTIGLENGAEHINGQQFPLKTHELIEVAGNGANGVVFKAKHRFLNRVEAVKLWLPRACHRRDKIKQALHESRIKRRLYTAIEGIYSAIQCTAHDSSVLL
jgi:serine/threonine protein kinase